MKRFTLQEYDYILTGKEVCYCAELTKSILRNWILHDILPSENYTYHPFTYDALDTDCLQYKTGNVYNALKQQGADEQRLVELVENVRILFNNEVQPVTTPPSVPKVNNKSGSKINPQKHAATKKACEQALDKIRSEKILELNEEKFNDLVKGFMNRGERPITTVTREFYRQKLDGLYKKGKGRPTK